MNVLYGMAFHAAVGSDRTRHGTHHEMRIPERDVTYIVLFVY